MAMYDPGEAKRCPTFGAAKHIRTTMQRQQFAVRDLACYRALAVVAPRVGRGDSRSKRRSAARAARSAKVV